MVHSYLEVLAYTGAKAQYFVTTAGRVAVATYSLGVVLMARGHYPSFVQAGLVAGAFTGAEAVGGPLVGRLADAYGQRRVLLPLTVMHLFAVGVLIAVVTRALPMLLVVPVAAAAGATAPQFGAFAAVRWSSLLPTRREVETAFSLEALANDGAFIIGPTLAAIAVAVIGPHGGVIVAVVLACAAGIALSQLATTRSVSRTRLRQQRDRGHRPRAILTVVAVLAINALLGLTFGTLQLSVTAFAEATASTAVAGVLLTSVSIGSLVATVVFGAVDWRTPIWLRLAASAGMTGVGTACFLLVDPMIARVASLLVMGLGIGPIIIASAVMLERAAAGSFMTQAFSLAAACSAVGVAIAGVLGGVAIDRAGFAGGMQLIGACSLAIIAISVSTRWLSATSGTA